METTIAKTNGANYIEHDGKQIVVNHIRLQTVNRSPKTLLDWRNAHKAAESFLWPNRTQLYNLYDDVCTLDGHLTGLVRKRVDAVLNKSLVFEKDKKTVDGMEDLINSSVFRDIMEQIMLTRFWGISGMEFIVGKELQMVEIPRKHIKPMWGIISKEESGVSGFSYNDNQFLWVVGKKFDLGLYLICCYYALLKRGDIADWAQYIEMFGQPIRYFSYDSWDDQTRIELEKVIKDAGSSLAIMVPRGAELKIIDGKTTNGDGKLQDSFKDAMNAEMSVTVLGNTETTASSGKSTGFAQSDTMSDQQLEITASDLVFLQNMLNDKKFIAILKSYGYPVEGGRFRFNLPANLKKLKEQMEIVLAIVEKTGLPVSDDYWYETYNIPKPDNYDEIKAQKAEERQLALQQQNRRSTDPKKPKEDEDEEEEVVIPGKEDEPDNMTLTRSDKFKRGLKQIYAAVFPQASR